MGTGFFVASEFALVAVERTQIEQMAESGHRGAVSTLKALQTLSFQLSGAQLGITVTSLLVGFIAEPTIGKYLEPLIARLPFVEEGAAAGIAVAVALTLATAASMVFGELVPKNLAIARPTGTAFAVSAPFRLVNKLFRPLILALNAAADWTVRRLGVEPMEELSGVRSLEELALLITSSGEGGALGEEEFALLRRSISFGGKSAADALVPRTSVVGLPRRSSIAEMNELALNTGHSRFPVYGNDLDDIVGMVHVKDAYRLEPAERENASVDALVQEVLVVPESRDLASLFVEMRRRRRQMSVVIDEYGGTAGIITMEDLVEEIVGDIEDEHDLDQPLPHVTQPIAGTSLLSGLLHPDEVYETSGFEIPEGDYETLAGFLLSLFDRIPEKGDHASHEGWELKVVEMERNRIAEVLLVAPGEKAAGDDAEEDAG